MVWNINYGGDKLAASIRNIQMVVIVVTKEFADNVAETTPLIQKMCLGYWTVVSKYHCSLHQSIPKGYATTFKMYTPRLVTKLEG